MKKHIVWSDIRKRAGTMPKIPRGKTARETRHNAWATRMAFAEHLSHACVR